MKKLSVFLAFILFAFKFSVVEGSPSLIPLPAQITSQDGQFAINADFSTVVQGPKESRVEKAVARFMDRFTKRTGVSFANSPSSPEKAALVITFKEKGLPVQSFREDESYKLVITPDQIKLNALNPLGVMHGLETLLQLVEVKDKIASVPCVTIDDKPRFAWRGLLLDACRHWMPVPVVERNLDGMAEAKMNVLHWHLSENQGFRVESKLYPKLQEMGGEGNFYTQEQLKDVIAYARDRGIRVVPEFDIPGHSTAWLVGYPELAAAPGPFQVDHKYGVLDGCMDPTKEEVYQLLDGFIGEMAALFPDDYFHIGGDEVNGKWWNENPKIQAFMVSHGFKTNDDLQAYFNGRILKILTNHHKKMEGWDEILHPDLPKTIVVQSWRGPESLVTAAQKGYDTILSSGWYLDLAQPASDHYAVDPLPVPTGTPTLNSEQTSHVLGGEACMWAELVDQNNVDTRLWPRTLAVAERLWSPASTTDLASFYDRMEVESGRLADLGLTHLSYPKVLCKELVGEEMAPSLELLAGTLEPLKYYKRHRTRDYGPQIPMDRLTDAVAPESLVARHLTSQVNAYLKDSASFKDSSDLEKLLTSWRDNDKALGPALLKSDKTAENATLSQDLAQASQVGLDAIAFLKKGKTAPASWLDKATKTLEKTQEVHVDLQLAIVPPIRKLALAAAQQDKLKDMKVEDWNKSLDDQVTKAIPKPQKW